MAYDHSVSHLYFSHDQLLLLFFFCSSFGICTKMQIRHGHKLTPNFLFWSNWKTVYLAKIIRISFTSWFLWSIWILIQICQMKVSTKIENWWHAICEYIWMQTFNSIDWKFGYYTRMKWHYEYHFNAKKSNALNTIQRYTINE